MLRDVIFENLLPRNKPIALVLKIHQNLINRCDHLARLAVLRESRGFTLSMANNSSFAATQVEKGMTQKFAVFHALMTVSSPNSNTS